MEEASVNVESSNNFSEGSKRFAEIRRGVNWIFPLGKKLENPPAQIQSSLEASYSRLALLLHQNNAKFFEVTVDEVIQKTDEIFISQRRSLERLRLRLLSDRKSSLALEVSTLWEDIQKKDNAILKYKNFLKKWRPKFESISSGFSMLSDRSYIEDNALETAITKINSIRKMYQEIARNINFDKPDKVENKEVENDLPFNNSKTFAPRNQGNSEDIVGEPQGNKANESPPFRGSDLEPGKNMEILAEESHSLEERVEYSPAELRSNTVGDFKSDALGSLGGEMEGKFNSLIDREISNNENESKLSPSNDDSKMKMMNLFSYQDPDNQENNGKYSFEYLNTYQNDPDLSKKEDCSLMGEMTNLTYFEDNSMRFESSILEDASRISESAQHKSPDIFSGGDDQNIMQMFDDGISRGQFRDTYIGHSLEFDHDYDPNKHDIFQLDDIKDPKNNI